MIKQKIYKTVMLFTFSHIIVHLFTGTLAPLLPLIRTEFALSYTLIGIITFGNRIVLASISIPAGMVSDKVNRISLTSLMFAIMATCAGALFLSQRLAMVVLFLILLTASISPFHPCAQSYLSEKYSQRRGKVFGIFEVGGSTGLMIAPLVAALLGPKLGWRYVYGSWGVFAAIMAVIVYFTSKVTDKKPFKTLISNFSSLKTKNIQFLGTHKKLKFIYLTQGFFAFVSRGTVLFLPIFLVDIHNFSVRMAGYVLTLFLIAGAIGKILGGRCSDRWGGGKTIGLCFLILTCLFLIVPFSRGKWLIITLTIIGALLYMILPPLFALTGEVKKKDLGFAYGTQFLVAMVFAASSQLLCGVISDMLGVEKIFFLFTLTTFPASLVSLLVLSKTCTG